MRVLFVVPPLTGHINPTVGLAAALEARGHTVAWTGFPSIVGPRLPPGARLLPIPEPGGAETLAEVLARASAVQGIDYVRQRWEGGFDVLARTMVGGVEAAITEFQPTAMVVDQQAYAGMLAARRAQVPFATLSTTSIPLLEPFATFPKVKAWYDGVLASLEREFGLEPIIDPDRSRDLVLVTSTRALTGPATHLGPEVVFVGPLLGPRPVGAFDWDRLDSSKRLVLVSLGSLNAEVGGPFFRAVAWALSEMPHVQGILVGPDDIVGPMPDGTLVRPWVPQLDLMPRLSAVVSHAGHNTVVESLLHGVPLVVAPIKDDQPLVAGQVVTSGSGVRVHVGRRATGPLVKSALDAVLDEPRFAAAARAIGESFVAAGGVEAAALAIEQRLEPHAGNGRLILSHSAEVAP
jgi:MGT family glycosyltransferase